MYKAGKVKEGLIFTIGGTAASLLAANPGRTYLSITNTHATQDLFVRFSSSDPTTALGLKIPAGTTRTWGDNLNAAVPASEVRVIGSGAGTTLYAFEHDGNQVG